MTRGSCCLPGFNLRAMICYALGPDQCIVKLQSSLLFCLLANFDKAYFYYMQQAMRGIVIADYTNCNDMKYAIRKLDDSFFRNQFSKAYIRIRKLDDSFFRNQFSKAYIRVEEYDRRRSDSTKIETKEKQQCGKLASYKRAESIPFAKFLNHDAYSELETNSFEQEQVSKFIAGKDYAPGDEDKKSRFYVVSALTDTKLDLKVLQQRLGVGKGFRMAPEEAFTEILQVPLGSVTPFALVNESARFKELLIMVDTCQAATLFSQQQLDPSSFRKGSCLDVKFYRYVPRSTLKDVRLLYATRISIPNAIVADHQIVVDKTAPTRCFPYNLCIYGLRIGMDFACIEQKSLEQRADAMGRTDALRSLANV
ncbi:prolyl-tRNA synthetase associated domain-containing protein 1 [Tanacetum coccineum]